MAFQYLMANYLLMADMEAFVANMDRVITYYEERDEPVPAHYVEALTLHCNLTGEWSDLTGVRRGAGIAECCQRFSELYRKKGDDPAVLTQILIQEMPNSYFAYYYVIFGNREVSQDS